MISINDLHPETQTSVRIPDTDTLTNIIPVFMLKQIWNGLPKERRNNTYVVEERVHETQLLTLLNTMISQAKAAGNIREENIGNPLSYLSPNQIEQWNNLIHHFSKEALTYYTMKQQIDPSIDSISQ